MSFKMRLRKCNICTYKNFGSKIHLKAQYIGILIIFCSQYDITGLERIINRIYMHKFFFLYYLQVLDCHYNIDSIHIDLKVCYCFKILTQFLNYLALRMTCLALVSSIQIDKKSKYIFLIILVP